MARFIQSFKAQQLADQVVGGTTYDGLITMVNDFLATLVNPTIRQFTFSAEKHTKRVGVDFLFSISYADGGAVLATPFTLGVEMTNDLDELDTAIQAVLDGAPTNFFTGARMIQLDGDTTQLESFFAAYLTNATAGASANYLPL